MYEDFDLYIGPRNESGYPVRVQSSPTGQALGSFTIPFSSDRLSHELLKVQNVLLRSSGRYRAISSSEEQTVQRFGGALFEALFQGAIRERYLTSLERVSGTERGLRLRLHIDPPELMVLPWEFLYDAQGNEFIGLSRWTPLIRYVDTGKAPRPVRVGQRLRILGMVASPHGEARLDIEQEKQALEHALRPLIERGEVELVWLPGQTAAALQTALWRGPWHIFHFIGHGGYDPQRREGLLMLADRSGNAAPLYASQLAQLLVDQRDLRLAVLNACESAQSDASDSFSGTASILARRGLSAVLAMQYVISDAAAVEFSAAFYGALAAGLPVDGAMVEARKRLTLVFPGTLEWGTPVLAMRAPDGQLFTIEQRAAPGSPPRPEPEQTPRTPAPTPEPAQRRAAAGADTAAELIRTGNALYDRGDYRAALNLYNSAIAQSPRMPEAYYRRGRAYAALKETDAALADYETAIGIDPAYSRAYNGRGNLHDSAGRPDDALADYERAIALDPGDSYPLLNRGRVRLAQGQIAEALADFNRAIALAPDDWLGYYNRARAYERSGERQQALDDFTQASALAPDQFDPHNERGNLRFNSGDYAGAAEDYTRAIACDSTYSFIYLNRARAYLWLNEDQKAEADIARGQELAPDDADLFFYRGFLAFKRGQLKEAVAAYSRCLELAPKNSFAYNNRGLAYRYLKDYARAEQDFTRAIELNSNYAQSLENRAELYRLINRAAEALRDIEAVIALSPQKASAYALRARLRVKSDRTVAISDFRQAIALDPGVATYHAELAALLEANHNDDKAVASLSEAIKLDPNVADYYTRRAYLLLPATGTLKASSILTRQALADYAMAIKLEPEEPFHYYRRGKLYRRIGNNKAAATDLKKCLDLNPSSALRRLARSELDAVKSWWPF